MTSITQIFTFLMGTMNKLVFLIIGIALVAFLWGVLRYIKSYNNAKERSASVSYIVYGLLSLLVITTLWGFVYMFGNTFGIVFSTGNTSPTTNSGLGGVGTGTAGSGGAGNYWNRY